ncbi:WD40-repeat-containing domain protein [Zopfochytrium polystomum]|nr:WD40-repeat-containing domain protein [Zopfochytrium polystomum]
MPARTRRRSSVSTPADPAPQPQSIVEPTSSTEDPAKAAAAAATELPNPKPLADLIEASVKRTRDVFLANYSIFEIPVDPPSQRVKLASKVYDEWADVRELPAVVKAQVGAAAAKAAAAGKSAKAAQAAAGSDGPTTLTETLIEDIDAADSNKKSGPTSNALILRGNVPLKPGAPASSLTALVRVKDHRKIPKPEWHAPWKLMRVISGHLGWVRSVTVDAGNEWFATGAGDRVIKIWDLASGTLKLSLTGHISSVRGLASSPRHPYLFSAGEDKQVKCWDLEYNKVIRHYHGHLSGVYCLALHPTLDLLVTGGRDSTARVWDMRTKAQIFALSGHKDTVADVKCQEADPQIITGSADSTVRLWDLAAGKTMATLTNHKKSVRAVAISPNEFSFVSASSDNIKQWRCPKGDFIQNLAGHQAIVNTLAINQDNVLFSGGDNGSMYFWDYRTGYNFQTAVTKPQPGSLDSENGIFCSSFDRTGTRLITGEGDKTIKIWKEDDRATPETHPINFTPKLGKY